LSKKNDEKMILFVGSLTEHKGLHIIIKAMKEVVKEIPKVKLLVVGRGKDYYVNYIDKLVTNYALQDHINFLGYKNNEDVLKLIREADIVVVPEQWNSEFGPVILIEAKLSGRPVVASRIGSIPEYVRDGIDGILVNYNCSKDFSDALITLLKKPILVNDMGMNISDNINNILSSNKMLDNLERLYFEAYKRK
jgi:glycosyltransferase involved in cell wall biosynthesis